MNERRCSLQKAFAVTADGYLDFCLSRSSLLWCSDAALEAELKTLLYYFRHHTVEPEVLKRLCFVELVYMLQSHPNRCQNTMSMMSAISIHACGFNSLLWLCAAIGAKLHSRQHACVGQRQSSIDSH